MLKTHLYINIYLTSQNKEKLDFFSKMAGILNFFFFFFSIKRPPFGQISIFQAVVCCKHFYLIVSIDSLEKTLGGVTSGVLKIFNKTQVESVQLGKTLDLNL